MQTLLKNRLGTPIRLALAMAAIILTSGVPVLACVYRNACFCGASYAATVQYNSLGQPVMATFPAPNAETVHYYYGANGRIESVVDSHGTTALQYEDELYPLLTNLGDRVASVTDSVTGTISYTYTGRGAVATKTLPDLTTLHYSYFLNGGDNPTAGYMEALNNDDPNSFHDPLSQIKDDSGRVLCWHNCDGHGGDMFNVNYENDIFSGCMVQRYVDYDILSPGDAWHTRGRVMKIVNRYGPNYDGSEMLWPQNSTILSENDYSYDAIGNRLTNTITVGESTPRTETYQYDELSRLTHVDYGAGETNRYQTYTFDDMGNRTSDQANHVQNYFYNAANMLEKVNSQTQNYFNDSCGNTLSGGGRTNTWDSQNRLRTCVYDGVTSTFTYGADGLRRSITVGTDPTVHYALDGQNVAQEGHLNNGTFVPDITYLDGPRGPECRIDSSGQVAWYVYDGLGSVVAEVDSTGTVTATRKYDVYGAVRGSTGTGGKQEFCGSLGHATEPDTGNLIYMRARWMDPVTGRFLSEDPAGKGDNWYAYCGNNPTSYFDRTGKDGELAGTITAIGAAAGIELSGTAAWVENDVLNVGMDLVQKIGDTVNYEKFVGDLATLAGENGIQGLRIYGMVVTKGGDAFFKACEAVMRATGGNVLPKMPDTDNPFTQLLWTMVTN